MYVIIRQHRQIQNEQNSLQAGGPGELTTDPSPLVDWRGAPEFSVV